MISLSKGPRDKSWVATVDVDEDAIFAHEGMERKLALHGLTQKVADAASGAKTEDEAIAAMQKAVDSLTRGEWSSRVAGDGATEETLVARSIMRGLVKAKYGSKSAEWATFTGLEPAEQNAKLDAMAEKNAKAIADKVGEEIARRKAARADKAKLVSKVDVEL
jgi:hypothetical protein